MDIKVYHKENGTNKESNQLRCLFVGSSGSGKTNLMLNFIYNKEGLKFRNLYVFSRSIEQPAYVELQKFCEKIEKKLKRKVGYFYSSCDDLIPLDECENNSLVVFDDCIMDKQKKIKEFFTRGRHKKISCIYLSQSYGMVDMQVIRNNINLLCVFEQNRHYTKRIYDDFVGLDMSFEEFQQMCRKCWTLAHGFISIDMRLKRCDGKYKCMLNKVIDNV